MATTINADNGTVSGSAGLKYSSDSTGVLALQTNGTTAVTVDASQNVGIGTASPATKLNIVDASATVNVQLESGSVRGQYFASTSAGGVYLGSSSANPLVFRTDTTERMRVNAGAPILCLSGGSTTATGTGIAFPATQSASSDANTLDDYEEGTFTPTIVGVSTAGTATYTNQVGKYTKIGDRVLINIYLSWSSGTGTGNMNISGLPFSSDGQIPLSNYNGSIAMAAGHVMQVLTQGTLININSVPSGGGSDANVPYDASGLIIIGGSYKI